MKKTGFIIVFGFLSFLILSAQEQQEQREKQDTVSSAKNFFIGAGVNGNAYINDDGGKYIKAWEKPALGGEAFIGKWFSHKIGARIYAEMAALHPTFQKMTWKENEEYIAGRLDFLLNFTNLFRSYSPNRFYNLIPYIGIGGAHAFNAVSRPDGATGSNTLMLGLGLWNTFRLSNHFSVYISAGLDIVDAKFDGWKDKNPFFFGTPNYVDGIATASMGLVYNFGKSSKKETATSIVAPQPQPVLQPQPESVTMETPARPVTPVLPPPVTPAPPEAVEAKPVLEPVFFRIDKSVIDPGQESKVKAAADYLKANPDAKLSVLGYADVETANPKYNLALSERRVRAVVKELVTKYKINSNRLLLNWKGDTVQPFAINEKNRVVMFVE